MDTTSEIITMYHDDSLLHPIDTKSPANSRPQNGLTVPEQTRFSVNDESPIDRFGPHLRRDTLLETRNARRSSCYSRNTDGQSLYGYAGEGQDNEDENYFSDANSITPIVRPTPTHLSVITVGYTTQHPNDSKLILQCLSDPYRTGVSPVSPLVIRNSGLPAGPAPILNVVSPESSSQPIYADDFRAHQSSATLYNEAIQEIDRGWCSPQFARLPTPPIRPTRDSVVSPSFRKPTSLVSPFKTPPSIVSNSTSRLGKYSIDAKKLPIDSKISYLPRQEHLFNIVPVVLITFCIALDKSIVSTAVPKITSTFNTIDDIEWYGAAYLLSACSSQLLYGRLYQFYTAKWIYITALAIFETGALISGLAHASAVLIFGRALAGLGAAGLFSGGVLIISQSAPLGQKSMYIATLVVMSSIAFVIGPVIGGALIEYASWRYCFFISLPIGLVPGILILFSFNALSKPLSQTTFKGIFPYLDLEGAFLFTPSILCLLLALQLGGTRYPWSSATVIVLFAIFFVTITGYIFIQSYKNDLASLPPRIFMSRNVYGGMLASFCFGASTAVVIYYLPLWFQSTKNASPSQSGAMLLPLLLSVAITSIASGSLVNYIGHYMPFLLFATLMMSIGGGLLTTMNESTKSSAWIGYEIIFGIGAGCGLQQTMIAIQASFQRPRDVETGTTFMIFAQTLGGAIAISIAQCVFENKVINSVEAAKLTNIDAQLILHTGITSVRSVLSHEGNLETVLNFYNRAFDDVFCVAAGLAAASILGVLAMEWRSIRGKGIPLTVH